MWPGLIGKLIGYSILMFFAGGALFLFVRSIFYIYDIFLDAMWFDVILLIGLGTLIFRLVKNNPTKWQNYVTIDLTEKSIYIARNNTRAEFAVLDYQWVSYGVDEIKGFATKYYEGFFFNKLYLVMIYVDGEEINLVSLSDPQEFTNLIHLLKDELNLSLK